jgi:hypothetical protein
MEEVAAEAGLTKGAVPVALRLLAGMELDEEPQE